MVAVASGPGRPRRSSSRARSRRAPRRAWGSYDREAAEVGLTAESSRAADDTDAQLKLATGQPRGQPPWYLFLPEASPSEPYPPEAVRRPLRGPRDRGRGVARTCTEVTLVEHLLEKTNAAERRQ